MKDNVHKGHRERMKKRFKQEGFENWQPHNVLEYLLFYVIPVANTNDTAHNIIDSCGSFNDVFHASREQLKDVSNVGEKTAEFIYTLGEFVRFYNKTRYDNSAFVMNSDTAEEYFLDLFDGKKREYLYMLCLDSRNRIIFKDVIFEGTFENIDIDTSKILRIAIKCDATYVVLAHNHPSGILKPSQADIITTQMINRVLAVGGIKLMDHIIVADGKCLGLREKYLNNPEYNLDFFTKRH